MMEGCPDADGDGVADKDDKCPNCKLVLKITVVVHGLILMEMVLLINTTNVLQLKGTVANNGCPEVSDEAMKKLNHYGKTILFNSGKSTFQKKLTQFYKLWSAILKSILALKFSLEGHTDSDGEVCI